MLPGSAGFPGSYNEDVLSAQPTDDISCKKLIEEVKNRAKACIGSRNYPEAVLLYSKAIDISACIAASERSILYANRSMVQMNMNKSQEALQDAEEAIALDSSYVKAYYRKAMACTALNRLDDAKQALSAGLQFKPDDKELQNQMLKVEEKIRSKSSSIPTAVPTPTKRVAVSHTGPTTSNSSNSNSKAGSSSGSSSATPSISAKPSSTASSSKSTKSTTVVDNEDEEEDEDLKNMRGYRKTSDGRTTTFFNHELDEQTKALIGNIAPKKLEATGEVITTGSVAGSVWNAAGTYEEKILTPWVSDYLNSSFSKISVNDKIPPALVAAIPGLASVTVEVTSVENITGDAQVTMLRGKKKHVCDFCATLKWQLLLTFSAEARAPMQITGQLNVVDITADREYEIEGITVSKLNDAAVTIHSLPSDASIAVSKCVKSSDSILQNEILSSLSRFWSELSSK